MRRSEQVQRLTRAKESTLDYRMGIRKASKADDKASGVQRRPNPVALKGWTSLVEERIERARSEGQFRSLKGRGKPFVRRTEEQNPFIGTEEYLMNRIVQRNGAAPPWVELQTELISTITSHRAVLRESWSRRAVRMLTTQHPPAFLAGLTLVDARSLRDKDWEARERSYHDTVVGEMNSLVRRYNGVAPYPVRRPYHDREAELALTYEEAAEDVLEAVRARVSNASFRKGSVHGYSGDEDAGTGGTGEGHDDFSVGKRDEKNRARFWDVIRGWFVDLRT